MQIIPIFKRISKASYIVALGALMMVSVACPNLDGVSREGTSTYIGGNRMILEEKDVTIRFAKHSAVDGIAMYVDDDFLTGLILQKADKEAAGTFYVQVYTVIDTATNEDIGSASFKVRDEKLNSARITFNGYIYSIVNPAQITVNHLH